MVNWGACFQNHVAANLVDASVAEVLTECFDEISAAEIPWSFIRRPAPHPVRDAGGFAPVLPGQKSKH